MKSLKPSMKENKRYLLVKGKDANKNIERAILEFAGVNGMSKTGLIWISTSRDSAIIGVNREAVDIVRASLCVFRERMTVEKVSGTLRGLGIRKP
jgi:RNase P/RNase MRP subunit POP5